MINLMYIHGLHSQPRLDKIAILERYSDSLFAPHLDYENNANLFSYLLEEAREREINFVVGSSAGGLMGYWLGRYLGCTTILFNPALAFFQQRGDLHEIADLAPQDTHYYHQIVIGAKDDVVDPQSTVAYLEAQESEQNYRYEIRENLGHRIDIETFAYACEQYLDLNPNAKD